MIKLSFHSVCDLITNSSTTIYSWYDGSVSACKELINEILATFNIDKRCDDLFYVAAMLDDFDSWYDDMPEMTRDEEALLRKQILHGEIEKPQWMVQAEQEARSYDNYKEISFFIEAKSPEYAAIADKISNFLYSPEHQEAYN